ncbi:hypothetical protein ACQUSR_14510 [Streptomyces sp. P1-3]|uniref:hypothetical protein n=1 Tax=Streptomyces sp. P1-3 TaxID=3421658 RepID=UPI003D35FA8A
MAINRAGTAGEPGYALLIAAGPSDKHGKQRVMDATAALPQLAAVAPAVLLGTPAGASVVQLVDPADPQTVLTHLRTAAAHPGPVLVYLAGQLTLDAKQRMPHLALARTTPRTARYTALPWHWLAAELGRRPVGGTTLIADLVADETIWPQLAEMGPAAAHHLAAGLALYGTIAPVLPKRQLATPHYSRALAILLRGAAERPHPARLHERAALEAGLGAGPELLLAVGPVGGDAGFAGGEAVPAGGASPGVEAWPTPAWPTPAGPGEDRSPIPPLPGSGAFAPGPPGAGTEPVPPSGSGGIRADLPAPGNGADRPIPGAAADAVPPAPAPRTAPSQTSAPDAAYAVPSASASATSPGTASSSASASDAAPSPAQTPEPDRESAPERDQVLDREPVPDGEQVPDRESAPDREPTPDPAPTGVGPSAAAASPTEPAPAAPFPPLPPQPPHPPQQQLPPQPRPVPQPPDGRHAAILEAARAGRHSEAAAMAAAWEQEAMRGSGPSSPEAVHWLEVRADLARLADDPARACELWMAAARIRLGNQQQPGDPDVEGAVDRAHHQWQQVQDPVRAGALAPALVELRTRVPGRRPGALDAARRRAEILRSQTLRTG